MIKTDNFEKIEIDNAESLRQWLSDNQQSIDSFWLVTFKKSDKEKYVSRDEVLDELISFGWIDGIRRKLDEERTMQLISPRKSQHWSKTYKVRAAKLEKEGRMHHNGIAAIKRSKELGLWDFLDDVDNLIIPEDLLKQLSTDPDALRFFNAINDSSKRFVLRWLKLTKTEKTRIKRIQKILDLSIKGEKLPGS